MFKHIVMWRVVGSNAAEKRAAAEAVKREFEALPGHIPGLVAVEVGINVAESDVAFDVVLLSTFTDREAYRGYVSHPEHLAVRDRLAGKRLDRVEVDYQTAV